MPTANPLEAKNPLRLPEDPSAYAYFVWNEEHTECVGFTTLEDAYIASGRPEQVRDPDFNISKLAMDYASENEGKDRYIEVVRTSITTDKNVESAYYPVVLIQQAEEILAKQAAPPQPIPA